MFFEKLQVQISDNGTKMRGNQFSPRTREECIFNSWLKNSQTLKLNGFRIFNTTFFPILLLILKLIRSFLKAAFINKID